MNRLEMKYEGSPGMKGEGRSLRKRDIENENHGDSLIQPGANHRYWKFYLGYKAFEIDCSVMQQWGLIPEEILQELNFGERRLIHYLAGKSNHVGCCYITQHHIVTKRFLALRTLIHKGIVNLIRREEDVVYFKLADLFLHQKIFNIHTGKYLH